MTFASPTRGIVFGADYYLDRIVNDEDSTGIFREYVDEWINETVKFCKEETNHYTIKRDCYLTVVEWAEMDTELFLGIDPNNIRLYDYVRIRQLYGDFKHRLTVIDDILKDE
jgi:hypothetical protein